MVEERPWSAASVLRRTHAALARRPVFRAVVGEMVGTVDARSPTDAALVALCPGARASVVAYYAGERPPLRDALGPDELRLLDGWLSSEVRRWARRWHSIDPSRAGSAPSTRAALGVLVSELETRGVPEAVMTLMARVNARSCPTRW